MRQCYIERNFKPDTLRFIAVMNHIIAEYLQQGFVLTVRQLYYQLVARDIIPNTLQSYKNTASVINDAKLAGLLDWDAIEDRTREFVSRTRWTDGPQILRASRDSFHVDMWDNQGSRVFVIVEKEALVGVLEPTCRKYDVPLLAARGYPSGSVLRDFVERQLIDPLDQGQFITILHLGDHDPSGIDMTRDIDERISLFSMGKPDWPDERINVKRIALNMDQIDELRPPENPAKSTDARFAAYARRFGTSSWELDALSPTYLATLLETNISQYIEDDKWAERVKFVNQTKKKIEKAAATFK